MGDDACGACTVMCIGFKNTEVKHEWSSKPLHGEEVPSLAVKTCVEVPSRATQAVRAFARAAALSSD